MTTSGREINEEVSAISGVVNRIGSHSVVELHFALKLEDGSVVDSTFEKQPAKFTMGDGNLLPGFEQALLGLPEGVRQELLIKPEQGFGMPNPNNVQKIKKDQFAQDMELTEGLMVSFADANKAELPGVIKTFDEQWVWVDFNHPLAGKTLTFDVQIIAVRPADKVSD
ncbi:FKBP-type peptidyl-prolyl cis-trans isomerase [Zooshikella ganghwensis]|uniref:Peptidyl-prolyl cis-trans isomerase n=1 Tax=Zooshikella ganghwensis TaxID=202772 RepID=A0A4P9VR64_9GAMM|nr:FKBP-type peptidyl-prolyl cis-trans isomerase [Zooshikella ganghwensis]RDH45526.1 FKBP-type peptidyl-prolyl cis-trans isomerase [Zooshikella ganghwensis]